MNKKLLLKLILLFSFLGIFLSVILTVANYSDTIAQLCGLGTNLGETSCQVVAKSSYSSIIDNWFFGVHVYIPLSLAGVGFYGLLAGLVYYVIRKNNTKKINFISWEKNGVIILASLGLMSSIVFEFIQAFLIKAFCKFCAISALFTLIIFILVMILFYKK